MIFKSGDRFESIDIDYSYIIEIVSFSNRIIRVKDNLGYYKIHYKNLKTQIDNGYFSKMEE